MAKHLFSSESVTKGHPDKICDRISDSILDAILAQDPNGRVACETCCTTGMVLIMGEISTTANIDIPSIARKAICDIGYDSADKGFDGNTCAVLTSIDEQSGDIALGVDHSLEAKEGLADESDTGAGDQGMMFGFACDETPEYMPAPIAFAHRLTRRLAEVRKDGTFDWLRPDGKAQVTVEYGPDGAVKRVDTIVVSTQHAASVDHETICQGILREVIREVIPASLLDDETRYFINPTGRFVIGGPAGDSGLTGRKIIVDTYGGYASHGGGAFSGKDPTKVDRSAAYMARYMAKNIVAAGLARRCQIELAYAIGVAQPVSVIVDTQGTGLLSDDELAEVIGENFDLRPAKIIERLNLRRPIYRQCAAYGHFGRTDIDVPWEKLDAAETLKKYTIR